MSDINAILNDLGFGKIEAALPELYELSSQLAFAADTHEAKDRFESYDSFIPADVATASSDASLIIDVGGTSTKASIRYTKDGNEFWKVLFEEKNRNLNRETSEQLPKAIQRFADTLGRQCSETIKAIDMSPTDIRALALVWSNPMRSEVAQDGRSITAIVSERELYNKGEWFIEDLADGDDLGALMTEVFREHDIRPEKFLFANDCPLTMKAGRLADGGMVASTGVNGTIICGPPEKTTICNAEIGQKYLIPDDLLTVADVKPEDQLTSRIECLIGGRFLPRLLVRYANTAAELGFEPFRALSDFLQGHSAEEKWRIFRGKDMAFLERREFEAFIERRKQPELFEPVVLIALSDIATALLRRSAILASVVAFGTCARQLHEKDFFRVAIDTRLGREIPSFWKQLVESTHTAPQNGQSIELQLLEPLYTETGSISVPMKGAASALDSIA